MECSSTNILNYKEFSNLLHDKVDQGRIPVNGSIELTARCNLRCEHCYLPFSQRQGSRQDELSLAEIQRIFSEIADAGCLWLLLTGGEPLLRRDFLEIYDDAKRKGFIITLFTNGALIDEQIADHLAVWRPFAIEISLYGATQATYERVTGIPGSYARCRRGIELLLERGLPLQLKSVLITLNQHELDEMRAFSESLGMEFRFDPVINAGIDGDLYPTQFRLSPEQIVAIEGHDPRRAVEWPKLIAEAKGTEINTRQMYLCAAGRTAFHIDATGKLSLCLSARTPNYDLRQGSFRDGWERFLPGVRAAEYSQAFACSGCALRAVCPQCPAMGLTEFGNPEAQVPFICQLAHQRQAAFDIPIFQPKTHSHADDFIL
jgi:radical SAM protein with 4Fe4S-binding SPASM domain